MTNIHITRSFILRAALVAALCSSLTGCLVGPKYHKPETPAPPTFKELPSNVDANSGWQQAQPNDAQLRGKWWEIFGDSQLNSLEEQLNINNQTIKQYFENLMAARAEIRQAQSQYYPTATVGAGFTRTHPSSTLFNGTTSSGSTVQTATSNEVSLPFDISWEPDLFGRVRNTVREYQYNAQLTAADLENERLIEQATLAEYYFEIRAQDALQVLAIQLLETDQKTLDLTQALYEEGIDDAISVEQARNAMQIASANSANIAVNRALYEHAIAMLIGKAPADVTIAARPMTMAPPPIPVGVPSQLLERRPDVAAAERQMAEANAVIGIGYAAYYPTLTLSAEGGFESQKVSNLFTAPSGFWTIGPSVSETIFDAGLRRATIDQYIAQYNADLAQYKQTVLTAFQQVEDFMATVRILSQQIALQQGAVVAAQSAFDLENSRYETGIDPYVDLLTQQQTLITSQQTLAQLQEQQMTAAVQLVEALGGGWDASQLPTPKELTHKAPKSERTKQQ
jgi:NodT family efflux transporter outer membrane factor (OMF) lipoprotein